MMRLGGVVIAALLLDAASSGTAVGAGAPVSVRSSQSVVSRLDALRRERQALLAAIRAASAETANPTDVAGAMASDGELAAARVADLESSRTALDAAIVSARAEVEAAPGVTGPRDPQDPQGLGTLPVVGETSQVTSGTAFNPSLAVIPDGVYYRDNPSAGASGLLGSADGFAHHHQGDEGHSHGGAPSPGFALRETEIAFTGAVDPYFDVTALMAVGEDGVELEEVYGQTRRLLPGMTLRFGKFLSGFGYANRQHPHQWDFVDQALPYVLLTAGGLNDTGVRLTWLPKLPFYAQLGVEALQGSNEALASQLGKEASPYFSEKPGPRLLTAFARVSPNLGFDHALQLGASFARSLQHQSLHDHVDGESAARVDLGTGEALAPEAFQGTSTLLGLELLWKYDSPKPFGRGDFRLQTEYLRLTRKLDLVAVGEEPAAPGENLSTTQDGLYAQVGYGFASRFAAGLRFDVAGLTNNAVEGGEEASFEETRRLSASVTFDPTEFSRLRVQYSRGSVPVSGTRESFDEVYVQFQLSLGAHGAHSF